MQEISLHELREGCSSWQKCPRQIFIGRGQDHSVKVRDRNLINQRIVLGGFESCTQSFADFEGVSDKIMDFLTGVRGRPQALSASLEQRMLRLEEYLLCQIFR